MNRIRIFFSETYAELTHKVSWPTWDELMSSAIVVTVATIILAIIVWAMNEVGNVAMKTFYDLIK